MTIWLPVALLAIFPGQIYLWALCIAASVYSGIFLVLNLKSPVQESLVPSRQAMTLMFIFIAHQMVAIFLRTFVLTYTIKL
jgi:hypothetical protein